jgi:hypothetical protein
MTLTAPRSRQGRLLLVLAFLAASVAVVGGFLWANSAQADMPTTTPFTLIQAPASPGPVAPGSTVTYTLTLTTSTGDTLGPVVISLTVDTLDLQNEAVTCPAAGAGGVGITWTSNYNNTTGVATCTSSATLTTGLTAAVMTVAGEAIGPVAAPTFAKVFDATGPAVVPTSTTGVGPLSFSAGATVTCPNCTGSTATNVVGAPETFTFHLLAGVTCASDTFALHGVSGNDLIRDCYPADVTVTPGTTGAVLTSGPTVLGTNLAIPGDVTVTIQGTTAGTAIVALHLRYEGNPEFCPTSVGPAAVLVICQDAGDDTALADVTATKIYATATGGLCHLDLPDAATENAAGNINGILYVGNNPKNGCVQDDVDDATGSFHAACLENSNLTFALNSAQITWVIQNGPGGNATVNPPGGIKFAGPTGEPCVRWGSGGTGTQTISATWDPGVVGVAPVQFFWDDSSLPLIKEWNKIDSTKIINATGNVGDTLAANTLELANWVSRDCSFTPALDPGGFCARANLNGTTMDISGVLIPNGQNISAKGASFIDYTMGSHNDAGGVYNGPVDGAQQTYTISGGCGSLRVEDPTTGNVRILDDAGETATVNSSDKGVAFQIVPNSAGVPLTTIGNANCQPDSCVTVTIDTQEAGLFHSPPLVTASQETINVCFHVGPPTNKQPLLAWAGQRIVLEHDWSFTDANGTRQCPFAAGGTTGPFFVRYVQESGNGALISDLGHGAASGPDFMVVQVNSTGNSNVNPEDNCVSRVIYEAQDQGEQDVVAHVVVCQRPRDSASGLAPVVTASPSPSPTASPTPSPSPTANPNPTPGTIVDPDTCTVVSQQVAFLVYYMKFEDVTLKLLPDQTTHTSSLPTVSSTAVNAPAGADSTTANVSANVLARATVRGWVLADNCPAANVAKTGSNGEALPASRCIFPDDWLFKAGGAAALETRANYDIYGGSTAGCTPSVAGPFSQLDAPGCGGSLAPHAPFGDGQRETNFPDGVINANDAPMPSALIRFGLTGSGFLTGATKANPNGQFDVTHIPAEPWISPTNADGSGYQWNSWGTGPKSGVYHYWTDFADHGPAVLSCGGVSPCSNGVPTGGFDLTRVYSDEHGNAMTWINGDANLSFSGCANSSATAGHQVVLLNGFFCQPGDAVGSSTLNALADYPDKRKHFAIVSSNVTVNWTWGGIKNVTVVPDPANATGPTQFHYVVLHVTDRDGFCGGGNSLHPVLGEQVNFRIDSTTGVIAPDVNGNSAEGAPATVAADAKSATTTTFDTVANPTITIGTPPAGGECQAWIHVSESLLNPVNVIVTAFDPEGTVTFDTTQINPTPTPSPTPSPTPTASPAPTPVTISLIWGDTDCSGTIAPRDAQAILKRILEQPELSVNQPCPGMGQQVIIAGHTQRWADWDCSGDITPRDAQAVLKNVLQQTALSQTQPCPVVGSTVAVQVVSLP